MRRLILAGVVAIVVAACGRNDVGPDVSSAVAPPDAAERQDMPAKCKDALAFDSECTELFNKAFGPGAGENERARLNTERAYRRGNAHKPSTVEPADTLGIDQE